MDKFNMFYFKNACLVAFFLSANIYHISGQGNCLAYPIDSGERIACELSYRANTYRQGSRESQFLFEEAIKTGPKYAYAYYQKSVALFKRGLLAEGISLINKAIELEPQNYLYYRAYWYFYNRNYDLCIRDLEELYTVHQASYVTNPSGELEMRLLLAMAYGHKGHPEKGIPWIQNLLDRYTDQPKLKGYYDHYCLGVLLYMNKQFDLAEKEFQNQLLNDNNFADTFYYVGLLEENKGDAISAKKSFEKALAKMKGQDNGYSVNLFTEFNLNVKDIESKIASF